MCPLSTIFLSSYYWVSSYYCVFPGATKCPSTICVSSYYMCPHTTIHASSGYYICLLIQLYLCVRVLPYKRPTYFYVCVPLKAMYCRIFRRAMQLFSESSYYYKYYQICVLILCMFVCVGHLLSDFPKSNAARIDLNGARNPKVV